MPNARPKLVVNEPTLVRPTLRQISATRAVGVAQQLRGALEPASQEVLVRRLAEGAAELAAEVRGREACGAGECGDVERLAVAGVDQILGAEQVTRWWYRRDHLLSIVAAVGSQRPLVSRRAR